jgi:hypothetical protein
MAYTRKNFQTKKELLEAVALGNVSVFQPGPFGPDVKDGIAHIEGPQFPQPHKWYAAVEIKDGVIPKGSKVK